jgi:microcin C transport system substrate-binding protein
MHAEHPNKWPSVTIYRKQYPGHRQTILSTGLAALLMLLPVDGRAEPLTAIAMQGAPKYAPGFAHFDYVDPAAPKGGTLRRAALGSYDTLNPYVIKGRAAEGLGLIYEPLMRRGRNEPFTLYALIAESVETPDDRAWAEFTLDARARFSDGSPITVADVIFSVESLREKGKPNARATWGRIARVEETGPRRVRFTFVDASDREMPLLVAGFLPILSKAYWQDRDFTATTLEPPVSSGPYKVAALDPGRSIAYQRDPDYWGRDLPSNRGQYNFDELRFDYYRDSSVALEAFKAGDYDLRVEADAARWATQYEAPAITDGRIRMETVAHGVPSGLSGLAFNLRRPLFADRRVREALTLSFDFEWLNHTLLHDGYVRTNSLFDNSPMQPTGVPAGDELALLEAWRGKVPDAVFGDVYAAPKSDGSGRNRTNLREAARLLEAAGWTIRDGVRVDAAGNPFRFEILLRDPANERIALAWSRMLKPLGIEVTIRLVESAQFQGQIDTYDFDMVFGYWGVTLSPGNEQQNYWSSKTANQPGGRNWTGIADPAVDAMIEALGVAQTREELVAAARALDRILMQSRIVIPLWHDAGTRLAYWTNIARPPVAPVYGPQIETFWSTR